MTPQELLLPVRPGFIFVTLVAALLATLLGGYRGKFAGLAIGVLFLTGGISMVVLLPEAPLWFVALDLVVAYIPMGWLGWKLADRIRDGRAKNAATVRAS
jgi:hypothetical protein